jgi:uncharacterized protein YcfJ
MNRSLFAVAALAFSMVVHAQSYDDRNIYSTSPGSADRIPDGATGPGIIYTQRTTGQVISVGAPVTRAVPIGQNCDDQTRRSAPRVTGVNAGTLIGGVIGGAVGSRFGGGHGREALTALGAAAGAVAGTDSYNQAQQSNDPLLPCEVIFEQRIVGFSYIAQYDGLQMQGFMKRQPRIGDTVEIIIRSVFYAGS